MRIAWVIGFEAYGLAESGWLLGVWDTLAAQSGVDLGSGINEHRYCGRSSLHTAGGGTMAATIWFVHIVRVV